MKNLLISILKIEFWIIFHKLYKTLVHNAHVTKKSIQYNFFCRGSKSDWVGSCQIFKMTRSFWSFLWKSNLVKVYFMVESVGGTYYNLIVLGLYDAIL